MRRLSGLLAILALFRFSAGGTVTPCVELGDAAPTHAGHGTTLVNAHDPGEADQSVPVCDHSEDPGCAAMVTCVPVLASSGAVLQTETASSPCVMRAVVDGPLFPHRAPDPPPPRA
jgi:hypothetical protein